MRLYINIDHVATVRQARRTDEPDPVRVAVLRRAGRGRRHHGPPARGPPAHPGPRRAAAAADGRDPAEPGDGARRRRSSRIACELQPDQATLVPERREEITTEGGLDVRGQARARRRAVPRRCAPPASAISLFIDPDPAQVERPRRCGADAVELHTGALRRALAARRRPRAGGAARRRRARRARSGLRGPRRPRADLRERRPGRGAARRRGAEHRAQHRQPRRCSSASSGRCARCASELTAPAPYHSFARVTEGP